MKNDTLSKDFHGKIDLSVSNSDPVAWKLMMLFEAALAQSGKIEDIAKKYGYSREYFYAIKKAFETNGANGQMNRPTGPKTDYVRTDSIKKEIIRHRFLDPEASCEVSAQKMQQTGLSVSQRSVERTIEEYGLQKRAT